MQGLRSAILPFCALFTTLNPGLGWSADAPVSAVATDTASELAPQSTGDVASTEPAVPPTAEADPPAEPEPEQRFDLLEFQVQGNTVLPVLTIEKTVYPHLGESKVFADVEGARTDLEETYRAAGFLTVLVDIPEQKVDNGVVRLNVIEGTVERLRVTGSRYYSLGNIRAGVPAVTENSVPNFPQLQKQIAELNRTPGRRITPVLKAGKTPGKVEVELKVEDKLPLHASLELNNRGSPSTTETRLVGIVSYDNLWQRGHSLSLQYQVSPQDPAEVSVFSASYLYPLQGSKNLLAFYAVSSSSDVAAVGDINVIGNGTIVGARAILPLPARENFFHSLTLGVDYKNFDESIRLLGNDSSIDAPIEYLPLTAQYGATQTDKLGRTQFDGAVNLGLRAVLADDQDFERKRFQARGDYVYFRGDLTRTHNLPLGLTLFGKLGGQLANGSLISNEQYSVGGVDSVRGYLESEQLGDDGVQARLELRSPLLPKGWADWISDWQALVFLEGAKLYVLEPQAEQQSRIRLSSVGLGVKLNAIQNLSADAFIGWPLSNTTQTDAGNPRVHVRLGYAF